MHYAILDGLRGIAALAVLVYHCFLNQSADVPIPYAWLAVDFFFMLSGFVIAHAYEARLRASMSFVDFAKTRLIRLYPMIVVGVLLGAAGHCGARLVKTGSLSGGFDLLPATFSGLALWPFPATYPTHYPLDAPEWSLFFEVVANLAYAAVVPWLSTKRLKLICVLSAAALLILDVVSPQAGLDVGHHGAKFFAGFVRVAFPFSLGVLLYRYRPAYRLTWLAGPFLGVLLAVILFMPIAKGNRVYEFIAIAFVFPPIVLLGSLCKEQRALNWICSWLGELSYPLYLTHHPIAFAISQANNTLHIHASNFLLIGVTILVSALVAEGFLIFWDRPARKWLSKRLLSRPATATPVPGVATAK